MDSFNYLLVWILTVLCVMGISNSIAPTKRICNGTAVSITDYPYTVAILTAVAFDEWNVTHFACGGTIISNRWVIAAAHCFEKCIEYECHGEVRTGTNFFFREGIHQMCDLALMHSQYDPQYDHDDIGLLRGLHSLLTGSIAKAIPFAEKPPTSGSFAISVGWGNTTRCADNPTEYLKSIEIQIIDSVRCQELYKSQAKIDEGMLCAEDIPRWKGTTHGDSGGPLVLNGTLVGITSFGTPPTISQSPDVFVNVSYYYNWIRKNTLSNSTQQVDTLSNSTQQIDMLNNSTQQVLPVAELPYCFEFKTNYF